MPDPSPDMAHFGPDDLPDLSDKRVVVTGANSGIGFYAAKAFAEHGAEVFLACRNLEAARAAAVKLPGVTQVEELDLASLKSVHHFADRFEGPLDVLVNNAGVMTPPKYRETEDGFELQFGTNHLGHFALTGLLLPHLLQADAPASRAGRVDRPPPRRRVRARGQPRDVVQRPQGLWPDQARQPALRPRAAPPRSRRRLEAGRLVGAPRRLRHQPGHLTRRHGRQPRRAPA